MPNRIAAMIVCALIAALVVPATASAFQVASTTQSSPSASTITLGASASDLALVSAPGTDTPTGTVTFSICGPLASATGCPTGGTQVGQAVDLQPFIIAGVPGTPPGVASSDNFTPTSVGSWCFRADYSGDSNYGSSSDGGTDECFTVTQAGSSTTSTPTSSTITYGESNTDSATVTGNSAGGAPTGTVDFSLCPQGSSTGCLTDSQSLPSSSGDSATATSTSLSPTSDGTWCFTATYGGDTNYNGSNDATSDECFTVNGLDSSTSSTPTSSTITYEDSNSDSATVTGNTTGGTPTGTVDFSLCPQGSNTGCLTDSKSLTGGANDTASATSTSLSPTSDGTWCFTATYSGDTHYVASTDNTSGECFTVNGLNSSTSSTPTSSTITVGQTNTDSATVTGNSTGGTPTGTVDFSLCPQGSNTGCLTDSESLTGGANDTTSATSASLKPTSAGTWCFTATYGGDNHYKGSSDNTNGECFTVSKANSDTASTPSSGVALGGTITDTASITGVSGGPPLSGSVSFFVCGPSASDCSTGGQAVTGNPVTVTPGSGDTATANSGTFKPTQAGTYCFRAEYSSDTNYNDSSDGSTGECVTVSQFAPTVVSTPSDPQIYPADGDSDKVEVDGNDTGGPPTGTVSFFVCGPTQSQQQCTTGGTQIASGVSLSPKSGSTDASTATSPTFFPTHAGTYCFRVEYSGDSNYSSATDGSTGECFTVLQPTQPSATISSPKANTVYAVGQSIKANYGCQDATKGPGIASCQGPVINGHAVNTLTRGIHKFIVTAVSKDGEQSVATIQYTVAGPPTVSIASPKNGAAYSVGQSVSVHFACGEDRYGTGLASCIGPSTVKTSKRGTFPFTVTAVSNDGQRTARTVHYTVGAPSNQFSVEHIKGHHGGRVTFSVKVPGGGKVSVRELASRHMLAHPKSGSFTFARLHVSHPTAGTIQLDVSPNGQGRSALKNHRSLRIHLFVTFTPVNGKPRTKTFKAVKVMR